MIATTDYREFITRKSQIANNSGFDPVWMPDFLFDFQQSLVEWAVRKGRAAIFADCGLGKTPMQLVWAENVVRKTNKPVLLLTPIAVGQQTLVEAEKFGIDAKRTRDGVFTGDKCIWITNYEQLHKYDPANFSGLVCDESSAIKNFKSERKAAVVEFVRNIPYRLLCTATAAPNDFWELGTSSEALGLLGFRDMLTTFFKEDIAKDRLGWNRTKYRFRGHAEQPFWSWVCSWARSMRMPSDLGFSDDGYVLPGLIETEYVTECTKARDGFLFPLPGRDMREERAERRNSLEERCDKANQLVEDHDGPSVVWCELNDEGDRLEKVIEGAIQISGNDSDEAKEEKLIGFSTGQIQRLVTKPKIGAWGLNWQHCSNVVTLPSHSYEQYYQAVRRCYRFGQTKPVKVALVVNEGEVGILANLKRKSEQANRMFSSIVAHMKDAMHLSSQDYFPESEVKPSWL